MIPSFQNNKYYNILKTIALVVLPALATAVATIGPAFGLTAEWVTTVVGAITSLGTVLGTILGVSSKVYAKEQAAQKQADLEATLDGSIFITEVEGQKPEMVLAAPTAEEFASKDVVHLQIVRTPSAGPLG